VTVNTSANNSHILRKGLGVLLGLLGITGIVLAVAGIAACWVIRDRVINKAPQLAGQAEQLLGALGDDMGRITTGLDNARKEMAVLEEKNLPAGTQPVERKPLLNKKRQNASAQLEDARVGLRGLTAAAVIANNLLEGFEETGLVKSGRIDGEQLNDLTSQLSTLIGKAEDIGGKLDRMAGNDISEEIREQSAEINQRLAEARARLVELTAQVADVRARIAALPATLTGWLTTGAVVLTSFFIWMALGQISLALHARACWRA
jgi:chromosome segregation ATPase